jgi:ribose-phosphate pyrophosphokinase
MIGHRKYFGELKLVCGNANRPLAEGIARELKQPLENSRVGRFDDSEVQVDLNCVVRGSDIFIIQPVCQSVEITLGRPCLPSGSRDRQCIYQSTNDNLMELLVMIDAARRASASRITAVVPYMAYAKQEKKKIGHEPITAKLVANLITTAGADRFLTVDLHTPAIEGFFDIPVDHMRMAPLMAAHFRRHLGLAEAVVVSPDAGGVARATEFRDRLKEGLAQPNRRDEMAVAFKQRSATGEPRLVEMVGTVKGGPVVIYDDMIQSGGTLLQVVDLLLERGATEVHAAAVHADLTPGALNKLLASRLKSVVLSDTINHQLGADKIQVLSTARILAQAIWRIHTQDSVGQIFEMVTECGELPPVTRAGAKRSKAQPRNA